MRRSRYCWRDLDFPKDAFMVFMTCGKGGSVEYIYPMRCIYSDVTEFQQDAEAVVESFEFGDSVLQYSILVPITLSCNFQLKRAYWKHPAVHYADIERIKLLVSAVNLYPLHKLLVTPYLHNRKNQLFAAAIPFRKTASLRDVEQFMYLSDFPVDPSSKRAAIYELERPIGFNWQTGELLKNVSTLVQEYNN